MKKVIVSIFILFSLNLMFSCKKETKKSKEIEEEFIEQVYSEVLIDNRDFDFGNISINDTVNYTYKIKNISNEPLIVTKLVSNCNCVEMNFNKMTIQKNQEMDIVTKFIAKKENN